MILPIKKYFKKTQANLWFVFFIIVAVSFVAYFSSLSLFFHQDDYVWLSTAKDILQNKETVFTTKISNFLMPSIYAYFTALFSVFKLNAFPYHLASLILHIINSCLLYLLTKKLTNHKIALISALIFSVLRYPMEAVVWISAATALITVFFLLLSGLCWLNFLKTKKYKWYLLNILFSILLFLTKEWSILLVPFLFLISLIKNISPIKLFKHLLPHIILTFIYSGVQIFIQKSSVLLSSGIYQPGFHILQNITNNSLLSMFPLTQIAQQNEMLWTVISLISAFVLIMISVALYFKKERLPLLMLAWVFIAFIPTSLFTWDPYVSRYAYLPAIGLCILLAYLLNQISPKISLILLFLYLSANILFINRVTTNYYLPTYQENYNFVSALQQTDIYSEDKIIFYDNTPIKNFILPDVAYLFKKIDKNQVQIFPLNKNCPENHTCLLWQSDQKIIQKL